MAQAGAALIESDSGLYGDVLRALRIRELGSPREAARPRNLIAHSPPRTRDPSYFIAGDSPYRRICLMSRGSSKMEKPNTACALLAESKGRALDDEGGVFGGYKGDYRVCVLRILRHAANCVSGFAECQAWTTTTAGLIDGK